MTSPEAIAVAVPGRFHGFELARQLDARGKLDRLFTTYPKFALKQFGVRPEVAVSIRRVEAARRAWSKLAQRSARLPSVDPLVLAEFDRAVSRNLRDGDLFVGWSGACVDSFRAAKRLGMLTVVERGSAHIDHQLRVLAEEYARWGVERPDPHPSVRSRESRGYELADYIMVPSTYARQSFLDAGIDPDRLLTAAYGVSLTEFRAIEKRDACFRLMHCGAVSLQKGVPYLLQAFVELNLAGAELWLVGAVQAEMAPILDKFAHPGIRVWGSRPQRELSDIYSQCSAFCLASVQEGMAMVQAQAMACGLPVIHSECTGGSDIVRHGVDGFCVPMRDVPALKQRILELYEDQDRCREMGANARRRVEEGFSWDDYGARVVSIYESILAGDIIDLDDPPGEEDARRAVHADEVP